MEGIAILAGLALGIYGWWLLVRLMKSRGSRWWVRHGVGWLVGPIGVGGVTLALMALTGSVDVETGEAMGFADAIAGLTLAAPLWVPLVMLWRGAKRREQVEPAPPKNTSAAALEPNGTADSSAPGALSTLARTLAQLKATGDRIKREYQAELVRQNQKSAEKEARRAAEVSSPGNLKFIYEDAEGNITTREVANWVDDGEYIEGYCLKAAAGRTFRRDRVITYLAGEERLGPLFDDSGDGELDFLDYSMEVLFTGLPAAERAELEDLARDYGMTVRSSVTKNLGVLVTGPKAGPTKVEAAREQGCLLLTPAQFQRMLETGEVPV